MRERCHTASMRALSVIILLTALIFPSLASAEIQTFTATHTYILGDRDSKEDARQRCLLEAKRKILEQAGVYIESASEVKNFDLTKDTITSFAAAVIQVKDTKEKAGFENGHMTLTLTLKGDVDLAEVRKQLAARQLDAGVRDAVAAQQERLKRLEAQFEAMQRQQGGQVPGQTSTSPASDISAADLQTLRTQAARGDAVAQNKLGGLYVLGEGVPQDYTKARQWFEKAAAQGHAEAQYNLGKLYANGKGVPQDYAKARQWFEKAAAQGYAEAQVSLGRLYHNGKGVPQDYAVARSWFEKAAALGNVDTQLFLGYLNAKGEGVPQDYTKARQWWEKAAAQGDASAQVILGMLYANGQDVPQDYAKARQWYEKAAAQGDAVAQYNLGGLYAKGEGVPQDLAKSLQWMEKAADKGYAMAQHVLGGLYANGYLVPRDFVRAYMWYDLAVEQYQRQGADSVEVEQSRDIVAKQMTPAQIAEAKRLTQQCQAQNFKGC